MLPCEVANNCLTYLVSNKILDCANCYYNEITKPELGPHNYEPLDGSRHPRARSVPFKGRQDIKKDVDKQENYKRASRSEQDGFKASKDTGLKVEKSANSGRVRQDGDWSIENILVDNKLQSDTKHPKINLDELDKANIDAKRNGKRFGVLRIENSDGRIIFILNEKDFYKLL